MNKGDFADIFHVDAASLEKLMDEARGYGAGYADLYFECSSVMNLMMKDSAVTSGGRHEDFGVGIRVRDGDRTGYAYCETTDYQAMRQALRAACSICAGGGSGGAAARDGGRTFYTVRNDKADYGRRADRPYDCHVHESRDGSELGGYPFRSDGFAGGLPLDSWEEADLNAMADVLRRIDAQIRSHEPRTVKVVAQLSGKMSRVMMFNSFGELCCDERPLGSVAVSAVFSGNGRDGVRNVTKSASLSFRSGAEMLSEAFVSELTDKILSGIDERFEAIRPKGGKMPVVMAAGASGILLHEAMGHAFEADFNRKGQSVFSERLGQKICPEGITIIDDGTIPGNRGSNVYDDEGVAMQKTVLVENGVLASYMHDRISAAYYGVSPTGNGRRESFRYSPLPRMRATYMDSGKYAAEEIVASVKRGVYVNEFSNGQVNIGEGDFTFYVNSGFLIENGRLTAPVKDINIIGNGPRALADIRMTGNDLHIDNGAWTCGKEQSVPVSVGIPTILVGSLAVGGE